MNAKDMRKLSKQVNRQLALEAPKRALERDAALKRLDETTKNRWLSKGIPQLLDKVKQAAEKGYTSYEEVLDKECPDYVVKTLRAKGFKIKCTWEPRGDYGPYLDWGRSYVHVLLIRWGGWW